MKTTNLEISKKLKEIGFEAECSYLWFEKDQAIVSHHGWIHPINEVERINKEAISYIPENSKNYPAYDLETLIDALPTETSKIKHGFYTSPLFIQFEPIKIGYYEPCSGEGIFESCQKENESLADTAGKLLIELFDAGIINFKK